MSHSQLNRPAERTTSCAQTTMLFTDEDNFAFTNPTNQSAMVAYCRGRRLLEISGNMSAGNGVETRRALDSIPDWVFEGG